MGWWWKRLPKLQCEWWWPVSGAGGVAEEEEALALSIVSVCAVGLLWV